MSIATQIERLYDIKENIRRSLDDKHIEDAFDLNFDDFAQAILDIPSGADFSATTAEPSEVIDGKLYYNKDGILVPGTMPNNSGWKQLKSIPLDGTSVTIPEGYHDGTGTVSAADHSTTFTIPVGGSNIDSYDMGVNHTHRKVNSRNIYDLGIKNGRYIRKYTTGDVSIAKGKTWTISPGFLPKQVIILLARSSLASTSKAALSIRFHDYQTGLGFITSLSTAFTTYSNYNWTRDTYIPANPATSWTTPTVSSSYAYHGYCACTGNYETVY